MVENGYQYYLDKIFKFNSDKDIIALREQYNRPSFFEIISKQRSETTYSAFLKWLFQIKNEVVSPIMGLLDILVQHSFDEKALNPDLRTAILSRKLKISNIQVETEKSVGQLAQAAKDSSANDADKKKLLENIAKYCQDRIDIFIECDIEIKDDNKEEDKKLQIIIENKIDSTEGGPHNRPKKQKPPWNRTILWRLFTLRGIYLRISPPVLRLPVQVHRLAEDEYDGEDDG